MATHSETIYDNINNWTKPQVRDEIKRLKLKTHLEPLAVQLKMEWEHPKCSLIPHQLDNEQQQKFYNALKASCHKLFICECCIKRRIENRKLKVTPYFFGIWYIFGCEKCPNITGDVKTVSWVKHYYDRLNDVLDQKIKYKIIKHQLTYTIKCKSGNVIWDKFDKLQLLDKKVIPSVYFEATKANKYLVLNGMCKRCDDYYEIPFYLKPIVSFIESCGLEIVESDESTIRFKGNEHFSRVYKCKNKLMV